MGALAPGNDSAFIFRSRIIKTIQKSSGTPHNIFILCAERLGAFLVGLPPSEIVLDRMVIETYGAFMASLKASESSDGEAYTSKKPKMAMRSHQKVNTKKKRNTKWVDLSIHVPENENENDEDLPISPDDIKSPTSPITPMTAAPKKATLLEELRECLEVRDTTCSRSSQLLSTRYFPDFLWCMYRRGDRGLGCQQLAEYT